jgi:NitT/TauT family transport system substrate-binding protein
LVLAWSMLAIAAVNQHSPLAMLALASKHKLEKPQDLKGLNIGACSPPGPPMCS